MLWLIEKTPHKILGLVHALPPSFPLPPWVQKSYQGMKRFVFEGDSSDPSLSGFGLDPDQKHFDLPHAIADYERGEELLRGIGYTKSITNLRPWKARLVVAQKFVEFVSGARFDCGIESHLRRLCEEAALPLLFLEKAGRPYEMQDSPEKREVGMRIFHEFMADPLIEVRRYARLLKAWSDADLVMLNQHLTECIASCPEIMEPLLTGRNREWLPVASDFMRSNVPTLFVVGCLHTIGQGSFLEQLKSAGYGCRLITTSD